MKLSELSIIYIFIAIILVFKINGLDNNLKHSKKTDQVEAKNLPCHDFYDYVCGEKIAEFKLGHRLRYHFASQDIQIKIERTKTKFLESLLKEQQPKSPMLKNYLLACLDEKTSHELARISFKSYLDDLEKMKTKKALFDYFASVKELGSFYPVVFGRLISAQKENELDLYFQPHLLTFVHKEYYQNQDLLDAYEKVIQQFFPSLGMESNKKVVKTIVDYEKNIAKLTPDKDKLYQRFYDTLQLTIDNYSNRYPNFFLGNIFKQIRRKDFKIWNVYHESLGFLHDKLSEWDLETIKAVMSYFYLKEYLEEIDKNFAESMQDLRNRYRGFAKTKKTSQNRKNFCLHHTRKKFSQEINYFIQNEETVQAEGTQETVLKMYQSLKTQTIEHIRKSWLTDSSKQKFIDKISNINLLLFKPSKREDWNIPSFETEYTSNHFIRNRALWKNEQMSYSIDTLNRPFSYMKWTASPFSPYPFYRFWSNTVLIPQVLVKGLYYSSEASNFSNYGGLGFMLAHEIAHALDSDGYLYGLNGKRDQLLNDQEIIQFKDRLLELDKSIESMERKEHATVGEDLSDILGFKILLKTLRNENPSIKPEDYKVFFESTAAVLCMKFSPQSQQEHDWSDSHTSPKVRVNHLMLHTAEFSNVYQCKESDALFFKDQINIYE